MAAAGIVLGAGMTVGALFLESKGVTPRALAPYIAKRSSGHNELIESSGRLATRTLLALDRGTPFAADPRILGYRPEGSAGAASSAGLRMIAVSNADEFKRALGAASAGDVITLQPGRYYFERRPLVLNRPGTMANPIVVRAAAPGSVVVELSLREGFQVAAPHWTFENLVVRGACRGHDCEHAFHVYGDGHHFSSLNNTVIDFNSHFKINSLKGRFPDHGRIIGNTITNTTARKTNTSVTLVDLVAASHWLIRGNVITDFIKRGGDGVSYGGFAKGAGSHNIFEQNIVICEHMLRGPGQRVGLSLGGGGTGRRYCRDGRCITEQDEGVIRSNLIASCSDDGIYINSAARSQVAHNTLLDTGGVVVRYAESSADVEGNLVDGAIRSRDGSVLRMVDNMATDMRWLYAGYHPIRALLDGASVTGLAWRDQAPRRASENVRQPPGPDLCGRPRPQNPAYGAFEEFGACRPATP